MSNTSNQPAPIIAVAQATQPGQALQLHKEEMALIADLQRLKAEGVNKRITANETFVATGIAEFNALQALLETMDFATPGVVASIEKGKAAFIAKGQELLAQIPPQITRKEEGV